MESLSKNTDTIDLTAVAKMLWQKRKTLTIAWTITFVLSCIWILPEPRFYKADVSLAPESGEGSVGGLSSIASSFGLDIGEMGTSDAIYPLLYPNLFESPEFIVSLFDINIRYEGEEMNYYTYLSKHQSVNVVKAPFIKLTNAIKGLFGSDDNDAPGGSNSGDGGINSFNMSRRDNQLMTKAMNNITCSVDKRTNVITITVQDQNALVAATLADSVKLRLQNFIVQYRTSKARLDLDYYQNLVNEARMEYDDKMNAYSKYCDAHQNVILQAFISERDRLEGEMSVAYQTYTTMMTQLNAVKAKVQESTPAFTTLKSATVPIRPAGPKRMLFVAGMLVLVTFVVCVVLWIRNKESLVV